MAKSIKLLNRLVHAALAATALLLSSWSNCVADMLVVPQPVKRDQAVQAIYRLEPPATGQGHLDVKWYDTVDRIVVERRLPLDLNNAAEIDFQLDLRRAVTMKNWLAVHLSLDAGDGDPSSHRESDLTQTFVVPVRDDSAWPDYQIIMWQSQSAQGYAALKPLGISGGMVERNRHDEAGTVVAQEIEPLLSSNLPWFVENIATDFYSPYHRSSEGKPPDWKFTETKRRYWSGSGMAALMREPSLSDPAWLEKVRRRIGQIVKSQQPYKPLYYSLGDETGVADLAAMWDFDFSEPSLAAFRAWLREQYPTLEALNAEWTTQFTDWEQILPATTRQAMRQQDENFAAWADFKEFMDEAFAWALKAGTDAVHAADPNALAAIEGAQIPGSGGYDYSRISRSVDVMELYDYGDNIEIARSLNPALVMLTTSFRRGPAEEHRIWRELLRGTRGLILWDDKNEFVDQQNRVGDRGHDTAPYLEKIRGGLGALLINSHRQIDPIAIVYSPASQRAQWMIDHKSAGEAWSRRSSSDEYEDDAIRVSTRAFARTIEHLGLQLSFMATTAIDAGALGSGGFKVIILPHTIALSGSEADEIRKFVANGGVVVADGIPGLFDEHGRKLPRPALADMFPAAAGRPGYSFGEGKAFAIPIADRSSPGLLPQIEDILAMAGLNPNFPIVRTDGVRTNDIETYVFKNGDATILALLRDLPARGAIAQSSDREPISLTLPHAVSAYNLMTRTSLGWADRLQFEIGWVEPIVLSLADAPEHLLVLSGPKQAHTGETVDFELHIGTNAPETYRIVRFDVIDPDKNEKAYYSKDVVSSAPSVPLHLPLALNDKPGIWQIRATDICYGSTANAELKVTR